MKRTAIYVDFDNIYGGILDKLGIPAKPKTSKDVTPFQITFLKEVLKEFFREFKKEYFPLCIKVFAEYENLPLSSRFSPSMTVFLHNIGVIPVNPFVAYSKKKENRNAADVALTLSAIEDLLIKEIPAETVIVCTHDIDLYPLILWLIEHTGKEILLASFPERTNKLYDSVLVGRRVDLNTYLHFAVEKAGKSLLCRMEEIKDLSERDLKFIERIEIAFHDISELYNLRKLLYLNDLKGKIEEKILEMERTLDSAEKVNREVCEKFKRKLLSGLKSWLTKREFASTGLIISSWLPRWSLGISHVQANECLKKVIQSRELEKEGIYFEFGREDNDLIYGKFYKDKGGS